MWNNKLKRDKGASLLEVVIGIAIIVTAVISAFLYYGTAIKVAEQSTDKTKAGLLLSEGAEAIRVMRDGSWSNISSLNENQDYYFEFTGSTWQATTTPQIIDNRFSRTFEISSVYRNSSDDIVTSGGTVDEGTKKVEVDVSWTKDGNQYSESLPMYIANIFES